MTGYETTIIRIAWYVRFYFEIVVLSPVWIWIYGYLYEKGRKYFNIYISSIIAYIFFTMGCIIIILMSQVLPTIVSGYIKEFAMYLPIIVSGYAFEKGKIVDKIISFLNHKKKISFFYIVTYPIVFIGCLLGRGVLNRISWFNCDIIIAPVFVFATWGLLQFIDCKYVNLIFEFLGSISLEIWFLHAIFFIGNRDVQRIAYFVKYPVIILAWTIVVLIPIALGVKKMVSYICKSIIKGAI